MKRISLLAALLVAALTIQARAAHVVWLEAELFSDLGGWTNDAQFIDQMGSPFLLAIGLEGPVADAVTKAQIPAEAKYRLWVRTRDWTPEQSPGRFQVSLDGTTIERVFGQTKSKEWVWEDGGIHAIAKRSIEVRLKDLTGHYTRCDAIVLTDDLNFTPPADKAGIAKLREQHGGVSAEPKRMAHYDTVVVGGGLAGTMAAIASARRGCKTALIQNRPVLGGNGSSEVLVNPEGDTTREPLDPGEGGIIEEFRGGVMGYSERMLAVVERQANLELFLNHHATGVEMKDKRTIAAVQAVETTTGQRRVFPATIFIDCTGDGVIGVWAGNEFRHGREPRSMYNESRAPVEGDAFTMGGTLRYMTERIFRPVEFRGPDWARQFSQPTDFNEGRYPQLTFGGWQWVIEYGGLLNTYDDAEDIRDELLRIIWGMWNYAKNHSPKLKKDAADYKLTWVSHVVGKRESRRLIGDYVMTEHDINPMQLFPDRVSYGGWGVDLHPPGGFYDKEPPATFSHKVKFSVPLRSLYAKDIDNLMMAGRDISVSHAALGATRVMITCGLQGQAVGTAAGVCKAHSATPRAVGQHHIEELQQQLLKDGCYLIDLPNKDRGDLALGAKATASSVAPATALAATANLTAHPLDHSRAMMFRVAGGRLEGVAVHLASNRDAAAELTATLWSARRLREFDGGKSVATATASVPAGHRGWVDFRFDRPLEEGFYYISLPQADKLEWTLLETQPENTARAYQSGEAWKTMPGAYTVRLSPGGDLGTVASPDAKPRDDAFAASNVVNGYARAIRGWPNSWRPDPAQSLPQWVELDLGEAKRFSTIHVSFQSKAMRARDFTVEALVGDEWKALGEVKDNSERRRVLAFDPVEAAKLRVTLQKAMPEAGICEIRLYDERP
jgi:hypothetical protein